MEIVFSPKAIDELQYWRKSGNVKVMERISLGIGKPEALKQNYRGYWSRRITSEHRMVYKVEDDIITIIQLRYHY